MTQQLFAPQPYSLEATPSQELVHRADKYQNYNLQKYGAYLLRFAYSRKNRAARIALSVPAAVEMIVELPVIAVAVALETRAERKFVAQAIEEYPHIRGRNTYTSATMPTPTLRGGTHLEYAQAVTAHSSVVRTVDVTPTQPPTSLALQSS